MIQIHDPVARMGVLLGEARSRPHDLEDHEQTIRAKEDHTNLGMEREPRTLGRVNACIQRTEQNHNHGEEDERPGHDGLGGGDDIAILAVDEGRDEPRDAKPDANVKHPKTALVISMQSKPNSQTRKCQIIQSEDSNIAKQILPQFPNF